jgi:hypothetical protein
MYSLTIKLKNLSRGQHWSILTFDDSTTQEFYMKEISSMVVRNMARFFIDSDDEIDLKLVGDVNNKPPQ